MSDKIVKIGDAKLKHYKEEDKKPKLYKKRRLPIHAKPSESAKALARAAAEDANTAFYVEEYKKGNWSAREDFIEYLADKFEFMIRGGKI